MRKRGPGALVWLQAPCGHHSFYPAAAAWSLFNRLALLPVSSVLVFFAGPSPSYHSRRAILHRLTAGSYKPQPGRPP